MTSPTGGEHISRYRALGEFDSLIREANKARRALRELREEEAKLNAQSLADDKKITASKQARARAEEQANESAKKSLKDLGNNQNVAGRSGEDTGTAYFRGVGKGIEKESRQSGSNNSFLNSATEALKQAFANAGNDSGNRFAARAKTSVAKGTQGIISDSAVQRALKDVKEYVGAAGEDTGNRYIQGFASKIRNLNNILPLVGMDKLNLDVDIEDARQSMRAIEFELNKLGNETAEPRVRIDVNRALTNLRAIQKLFKDEVAESIVKESQRIQEELRKVDSLPSGKSFKFWALTALSDMSRVFSEANKGTSVFNRLRAAITASGGGGGNNFIRSLISGFDDFSESSSNLLQKLGRVSGELYRMPGIIGVIVAALPGLVAGFGALVGSAGALGSGLGALSGFLAAGPGLFAALGTGLLATSAAFGTMGAAIEAAQKSEQAEAEAKEKSRLHTEKALTAQQKYKLAMDQLGPATQTVTEGVIKLGEGFKRVKDNSSEQFFKEIAGDMGRLNGFLPTLNDLLSKSASAVGEVASNGTKMVTSGPWRRDFATLAKNNADVIENLGNAALSVVDAFRNITIAAGPFTTWVTKALRDGADAFTDWSAEARADGTIVAFLDDAKESGQILWQIIKNLGSAVNSFFQSSVDEGQNYLRLLEGVTSRWSDVAKAQEAANSPLRRYLQDIKPVLTAMGNLVRDFASGIARLASDQRNLQTMISLLDTLRTDVLPPILQILQHLNDSGIALTVFEAFGDLLKAVADFLDSGATTALTVFVTVLSNFAELIFSFASLPVISDILGGLATALAALAAVSVVARFTGLFKLWDFFNWMARNRGNLAGAFADAARGVAGLQVSGTTQQSGRVPSSISNVVGSEAISGTQRATQNMGNTAASAAGQTNIFARALRGIQSAGTTARGALTSLTGFLGGPWGVALTAATVLIGVISNKLVENKREAEDTKNAFLALKGAYSDLSEGNSDTVNQLADTDEKFRKVIEQAKDYGLSLTDVSGALNNQDQSLTRFNAQIDTQIGQMKAAVEANAEWARQQGLTTGEFDDGSQAMLKQIEEAEAYKKQVNDVAAAQGRQTDILRDAAAMSRTYKDRLAGMRQEQVDAAVASGELDTRIRTLSGALDTMSSATSTAQERSKALSDIIDDQTGAAINANEAMEDWRGRILDLREALDSSGKSLSTHTRAGLRNRDALEDAAKATRELFLADIASGRPMDEATKRHQARIKELIREAEKSGLNTKEARKLIDAYGDIPEDVKTDITTSGYVKVYQQMQDLKALQASLQSGKSLKEAEREVEENKAQAAAKGFGDGYGVAPGFKTGGPVWGAGTRNSDSIQAWLSNGEFVHPTDAVEYYGLPIMEALRQRKLDRATIQEALPDDNAVNFANGGHANRFAQGGRVNWPFPVDLSDTLIKKSWADSIGGLGSGTGGGGWQWQMSVLRKAFPGLPLLSGPRPGAVTLTGNRSYHALGRAVDLPPRRDVAQWIRSNYGSRTKELITPWNELNLHNGKPHRYTGAVWNQHNFAGGNAHDHWAFNKGGLVDLMEMMGMNNIMPQTNSQLPTTPRTLSPAASNVVNNSTTDNGTNFGDVIINNPLPERGGDSIRNALYRTQYLLG